MISLVSWSTNNGEDVAVCDPEAVAKKLNFETAMEDISAICDTLIKCTALHDVARANLANGMALSGWIDRQNRHIQALLDQRIAVVRSSLISTITNTVEPMLLEVIEKKAIEDLCSALTILCEGNGKNVCKVYVPERLRERLEVETKRQSLNCELAEGEFEELALMSGATRIQTRMQTFKQLMVEALQE